MTSDLSDTDESPSKCDVCKKNNSVITLRHRNYCPPCASRFILQKFKKQMGVLSAFFETEKRETKGRLERLLVVADSTSSSEAMLKMLESYYVKEDAQNEYAESRVPETTILDVTFSANSRVTDWKPAWMEYLKPELVGSIKETAALSFKSGRLYKVEGSDDNSGRLEDILGSFPADSRDQVISILQSKIVSQVSQSGNFEVILYSDTATRIASKVLALTSQGKGFTLPWECGSFAKMPSGIYSVRPLKDLSDTEVRAYLDILHHILLSTPSIPPPDSSSIPTSIDDIMTNYITNLETSFPSIVATTGRTADKLELPDIIHSTSTCFTCGMPRRTDNVKDWLDNITVIQPAPTENSKDAIEESDVLEVGKDITDKVCYGCYTLFRGLRRDITAWPI